MPLTLLTNIWLSSPTMHGEEQHWVDEAMAITIFASGFMTNKSDERHGDGMVIHSDTGYALVIDGFNGGALTTSLVSYLDEHRYKTGLRN